MRFIVIILALMAVLTGPAVATLPALDAFLAVERPRAGAPGLTYALVDGDTVRAGMQGAIPTGGGAQGHEDTPFALGSISKSFTALAVMTLVEAGEVELDAPVDRYLPVFTGRPSGAVTVRHLLSHTSGFSTFQGNSGRRARGPAGDELMRHVTEIAGWKLDRAPGEAWAYSNANYAVLGALIEAVSGVPFAVYLQTEILDPAGMVDSFVADGERQDAMALGHRPWFGTKRAMASARTDRISAPAGGIIASASDLGRYLALMMNGQDDIVTAQTKAAMMAPASAASPFYGFGWYIDAEAGAAYHAGLSPGVETLAVLIPSERRAALLLVNANAGFGFAESRTLFSGFVAQALSIEEATPTGALSRKALMLVFALSPALFIVGLIQAVRGRVGLRAKSGLFGLFSLWFPLLMSVALAVTSLKIIPALFGTPLANYRLYQPDLALLLIATALTGLGWALARLAIAYSGGLMDRDQSQAL
jgi:CubicO group peptidase (beta-lactamase class C family)